MNSGMEYVCISIYVMKRNHPNMRGWSGDMVFAKQVMTRWPYVCSLLGSKFRRTRGLLERIQQSLEALMIPPCRSTQCINSIIPGCWMATSRCVQVLNNTINNRAKCYIPMCSILSIKVPKCYTTSACVHSHAESNHQTKIVRIKPPHVHGLIIITKHRLHHRHHHHHQR